MRTTKRWYRGLGGLAIALAIPQAAGAVQPERLWSTYVGGTKFDELNATYSPWRHTLSDNPRLATPRLRTNSSGRGSAPFVTGGARARSMRDPRVVYTNARAMAAAPRANGDIVRSFSLVLRAAALMALLNAPAPASGGRPVDLRWDAPRRTSTTKPRRSTTSSSSPPAAHHRRPDPGGERVSRGSRPHSVRHALWLLCQLISTVECDQKGVEMDNLVKVIKVAILIHRIKQILSER